MEIAPLNDTGAEMKEPETPAGLLGVSVQTVRQRYGARWPEPVQRWLKDASVAEATLWLEANSGDEGVPTNRGHGPLSDQG
jgi:hypothetical protein